MDVSANCQRARSSVIGSRLSPAWAYRRRAPLGACGGLGDALPPGVGSRPRRGPGLGPLLPRQFAGRRFPRVDPPPGSAGHSHATLPPHVSDGQHCSRGPVAGHHPHRVIPGEPAGRAAHPPCRCRGRGGQPWWWGDRTLRRDHHRHRRGRRHTGPNHCPVGETGSCCWNAAITCPGQWRTGIQARYLWTESTFRPVWDDADGKPFQHRRGEPGADHHGERDPGR